MTDTFPISTPAFGDPQAVHVQRAFGDFRFGRPVRIVGSGAPIAALPIDRLDPIQIAIFRSRVAAGPMSLVVTGPRAAAMGLPPHDIVRVPVPDDIQPRELLALAADADVDVPGRPTPGTREDIAAVELAKLAELLPAALIAPASATPLNGIEAGLLTVDADAVLAFRRFLAGTMRPLSEARVPIAGDIDTRLVVYRDVIGGMAIAIIIGDPDPSQSIPVRVHSSCATGDIFGSRRCDCGDQLQLALQRIKAHGSGAVLYMEQEGRGLGLANKMRAYALQDGGLDTVDANTHLGFHEDERDYYAAGVLLNDLGWNKVALLTNNPLKVEALQEAGIEVTSRIPVLAPINADNRRYLEVKASRSGHLLEHVHRSA